MRNNQKSPGERTDYQEIWQKISRYCAYQDRSRREVIRKLGQLEVPESEAGAFLEALEDQKFLDEARFAEAFARGKFFNNRWGRERIARALRQHHLSEELIQRGLSAIPESDYQQGLERVLTAYLERRQDGAPFLRLQRAADHAFRRGFEPDRIWAFLKEKYPADFP